MERKKNIRDSLKPVYTIKLYDLLFVVFVVFSVLAGVLFDHIQYVLAGYVTVNIIVYVAYHLIDQGPSDVTIQKQDAQLVQEASQSHQDRVRKEQKSLIEKLNISLNSLSPSLSKSDEGEKRQEQKIPTGAESKSIVQYDTTKKSNTPLSWLQKESYLRSPAIDRLSPYLMKEDSGRMAERKIGSASASYPLVQVVKIEYKSLPEKGNDDDTIFKALTYE